MSKSLTKYTEIHAAEPPTVHFIASAEDARKGVINMNVPRMRTLPACVEMLKEIDPETAITLTALRRKAKMGEIPTVTVGNKRLVNFDLLMEKLSNPEQVMPEIVSHRGVVRQVKE